MYAVATDLSRTNITLTQPFTETQSDDLVAGIAGNAPAPSKAGTRWVMTPTS